MELLEEDRGKALRREILKATQKQRGGFAWRSCCFVLFWKLAVFLGGAGGTKAVSFSKLNSWLGGNQSVSNTKYIQIVKTVLPWWNFLLAT